MIAGGWVNHLWQSTVFAAAAGLPTIAFRKNRAHVRYWMWLGASCKFLLPFWLLIGLGSHIHWAAGVTRVTAPAVSFSAVRIAVPFDATAPATPAPGSAIDWVPGATLAVWACGFAWIALIRVRGWLRVGAAVRASAPVEIAVPIEVRAAPGLLEPGVVGLWRPILLLPDGIAERLTPRQLEAVLAHELCHARRRDNLTAALHMIVEAIFWFHPLVWWIGARLVEERERACDEAVLSLGGQPRDYAEAILSVCRLYVESPLGCVPGVTGADLKRRIHAILLGRVAGDLNFAKKAALWVAGMASLAAPVMIGMMHAPPMRAQSPSAAPQKFEVVSVKPCTDVTLPSGGGRGNSSPGRLSTGCTTVAYLIRSAYELYGSGHFARDPAYPPIDGGPAWIQSDRFAIDARAAGAPSEGTMMGPMMQTILADRFQLKIHRETREVPVYDLTVAKGGARLTPFQEGSCTPVDFGNGVPGTRPANGCRQVIGGSGPVREMTAQGVTIDQFRKLLFLIMDRPVIDKTGISGLYDFHLEFGMTEATPMLSTEGRPVFGAPPEDPGGPSIFAVLERQFGLKLERSRGPREFLVIDGVERPTAN